VKPREAPIPSKSVSETPASLPPRGGTTGAKAERAEDRELVRRAQAGDQAAFRRLIERHADRAHALALRIVRSASDAEEVAQDAFVRAWRALPRFRGDAAFSSWLYRIVARRAFDRAAVLKGRRARETEIEGAEDRAAPGARPDPGAWERSRRIERLLAELPELPRTVVTLYYFEDRSVAEVARTLRMPENTVKTHLSRARAALRSAWTREESPPREAGEGEEAGR
jgi:RNA polymerase sigma-70 factor (ECF subfamily)